MNYLSASIKKGLFLFLCLAFSVIAKAQNPTYFLYITNQVLVDPQNYQFDIFLLRTGATPFQLSTVQFGLGFDTNVVNGGTLSASVVSGSSELTVPSQYPATVAVGLTTFNVGGIIYRYYNLSPPPVPGAGNGSIISNVNSGCNHPGTRLATFRLSNTVAFKPGSHFNHLFSTASQTGRTNTLVNAYVGTTNTNITVTANHLGYNSTPTCDANICIPPLLNCSGTNVTCSGGPNSGTASVTATSTTGPYTYLWSNSITSSSQSNLPAGTYCVTVTDVTGCSTSCCYTVTPPVNPTAGISKNPNTTVLTCTTTSIDLTATGGGTYMWDGGSTNALRTVSSAGTYTVTVTDPSSGCTASTSVTITSNTTAPTAGITNNSGTTVLTCTTTSINVTATGTGQGTLAFAWSGGATPGTAVNSFTTAGTYTVTVTDDANGCTATASITITSNTTAPTAGITNNSGTTVLTCTTTSINVTATGTGQGTLSFAWSGGATPGTAANSFSTAGTYTVTVTDGANGCTTTSSITITGNNTPPTVGASASSATICAGGSTTLTGSGASTYTWMPGSLSGTTVSVSPASTTTYTVTGTAANGCTATATVTVTVNTTPIIITAMKSDATFGGPTGTAGVTFSPGTCTILWSPGNEITSYIQNKPAGTYTATVTAPGGCTKVKTLVVN